jgi:hypothetical protein
MRMWQAISPGGYRGEIPESLLRGVPAEKAARASKTAA